MNSGQNTDIRSGFRTRYHITPIDGMTGEEVGPTTTTCNLVLTSGYHALGNPTAYSSLSIGTNPSPTNPRQTGILTPIAQLNITEATFNQHISNSEGVVFSVCSFEFVFKDFLFPANLKTLDLSEIGLDGVTRAVFPVVQITRNNWVKVIMEVIYEYTPQEPVTIYYEDHIPGVESNARMVIEQTAFIFNSKPNNRNGRGWGADRSIICYPWSGTLDDYNDRGLATTLGLTITPELQQDLYRWQFDVKLARAAAEVEIPGLIIRDTVNGGGFLLRFYQGDGHFTLPEDGSIDMQFNFNWNQVQPV